MDARARRWWKEAVVYQVYPRSFCDGNGDGIGDLAGLRSRLEHLQALGVDVVWLSPVYPSPNDDNGYDVSDYRDIHPDFGTLADFDALLADLHARGLRLMMDLVVNHTSDEHDWFRRARRSRDDPFHDFYVWAAPGPDGGPPNNWASAFSGPAWTWNEATGEYYLHLFSRRQPDLNWENPRVRAEVHALMRFWLDRGVDGFRMDVINMVSKPWGPDGRLPDAPRLRPGGPQPAFGMVTAGPRLLEFLRELRREVLDGRDPITVGEAPLATPAQGLALTDERDGALQMLFQFEHMDLDSRPGDPRGKWAAVPLDVRAWKASMFRWQAALQGRGWNSLYHSNHDQPRPVSRWGDDSSEAARVASAKLLATLLHGLQGTPFVYQGEELGLTNVPFAGPADLRDIESLNYLREAVELHGDTPDQAMAAIRRKGRDHARVPMPWDDGPQAGFGSAPPWIGVHPDHARLNAAAARADPDSVFHHYRRLIALRRRHPALVYGRCEPLQPEHPRLCAWLRHGADETLLVLGNFGGEPLDYALGDALPRGEGERLLGTHPASTGDSPAHGRLRPWEARIHRWAAPGAAPSVTRPG
ncbi:alpha-glucosidase [Piscinibacter sakaiensis]|uniref:Oligo-1,6-glucosidase n=1 Tax=Piscinibacter sakaiensis TaxID=1547922 RepID=A0A0K8P5S2_PISS1|nr:alpha-glucosidase [Piscinibacter sakaiensis]GAP37942.1 oligo-1,6-glucosidase [Piscinibacter sakaiensis]